MGAREPIGGTSDPKVRAATDKVSVRGSARHRTTQASLQSRLWTVRNNPGLCALTVGDTGSFPSVLQELWFTGYTTRSGYYTTPAVLKSFVGMRNRSVLGVRGIRFVGVEVLS
jgi:hypothetical protein